MKSETKKPNPVDIHVGDRVRERRKFLGLSQEQLADGLCITFQQVQKYERGANRISASKLFGIAGLLKVPVASFFEGYTDSATESEFVESSSEQSINRFLATAEGIELAEVFPKVRSAKHRRRLLELVRSLTEEE